MPLVHDFQPSFNAGELSPRLAARTDFNKFAAGLEEMVNLIPLPEGGAMRRAGSRYVAEVKDSTVKSRLKRFEFSTQQAYMLELGNQVMRFYRNQSQITIPDTDASITNGTFDSGITGWTDVSNGTGAIAHDATNQDMELQAAGSGNEAIAEQAPTVSSGLNVENALMFQVKGAPGDSVIFRVGSASGGSQFKTDFTAQVGWHVVPWTPTSSPMYIQFENKLNKTVSIDNISFIDNAPVEITTPWLESELFTVEGPQSADVLYLFHGDHPVYRLERRANTWWSLVEVAWTDGPYLDVNTTTTTMTPAATTGNAITVTASAITGINDDQGFLSTDLHRPIRIDNPASGIDWGWGIIVEVTSTTAVKVDIKRDFATTNADVNWALGAWSATTGYPSTAVFFESRLYSANTSVQPQTFWASQTDDFTNMTPDSDPTAGVFDGTVQSNDAITATISADNVNAIRWLAATQDVLTIGTSGGEWVPESTGAVITPSDITIRRQTTHGSAQVQPLSVGNVTLFLQKAKRKIREFVFTFDSDSYQAFDMTRLARHISKTGIIEMDFAEEPDSIVWAVRGDGVLLSMTFRREEDVVGWARHILGGTFSGGNAVVESVAVIPGTNGAGQVKDSTNRDEVWLIVKRTINGATKRYVEFFEGDFETGDDQEDSYYVDSMITYDGAATTTLTGGSHLEGETVKILGDGAIRPDQTVASGQITLATTASVAQWGLPYTHTLKTLRMEGGNPAGTAVGRKKRNFKVTFVLLNCHSFNYGPSTGNLQPKDFREVEDAMDAAAPYFTGESGIEFEGDWTTDSRIIVESNDPVPFTLLAIAPEVTINP